MKCGLLLLSTLLLSCALGPAESPSASLSGGKTNESTSMASEEIEADTMRIIANGNELIANMEDNESTQALYRMIEDNGGQISVYLEAYGGFEKWGPLPYALPSNDVSYSAVCGDILLYNDSNIVIMIGNNSWSYTKLGHIENASRESLIAALGEGDVEVTLTI